MLRVTIMQNYGRAGGVLNSYQFLLFMGEDFKNGRTLYSKFTGIFSLLPVFCGIMLT